MMVIYYRIYMVSRRIAHSEKSSRPASMSSHHQRAPSQPHHEATTRCNAFATDRHNNDDDDDDGNLTHHQHHPTVTAALDKNGGNASLTTTVDRVGDDVVVHRFDDNGGGGRHHYGSKSDSTMEMLPKSRAESDGSGCSANTIVIGGGGIGGGASAKGRSGSGGGLHRNNFRSRFSRTRLSFKSSLKERKATRTLGVIMGAFTACWLPFFIVALIKPFLPPVDVDRVIPLWLSSVFLWLGYANSFLNPIIYARFNRDFRGPFKDILLCRCRGINLRQRTESYVEQYGGAASGMNGSSMRESTRPLANTAV